jgi:PAB-dependent poly(A)-specific ribonuclease subunit 3
MGNGVEGKLMWPPTEYAKDTLCRNVLIYGHCRYEDQGCTFNHEPNKTHGNQLEL